MKNQKRSYLWLAALLAALFATAPQRAHAQAWDAVKCFQYNVETINFDSTTRTVTVDFSVTNPSPAVSPCGPNTSWNILTDAPFRQAGVSVLRIDIGWTTKDFTNTGSTGSLATKNWGGGLGAAYPITINALGASVTALGGNKFRVVSGALPSQATLTGRVAMEGRAAWQAADGTWTLRVPVTSAYKDFVISGSIVARREIVDIKNCQRCHNGTSLDKAGNPIPRLSLHGNNRNENLGLCVICHNPNQTDIPYRTSGAEVSVDLKRMVHSIHAAEIRKQPFQIIGFQGALNDFSTVAFPASIRNCLNCHIDDGAKGTFEIPPTSGVASYALGSTIETLSVPGVSVDVDPSNDWKITPIAAVCSSCHDDREATDHMKSKGASFHIQQASIVYWTGTKAGTEKCPACHGPGKDKDVRKVHDIGHSDD